MKRYSMETIVGIFVVIGIACIGYMTIRLGKVSWFGNEHYTLYAPFSSVTGLRVDSPVEINGLEVGRIKRLSLNQDRQIAMAELSIRKEVRIYDDAIAGIKTSGLIGDKFVRIDPGGSGEPLKSGGTIVDTAAPLDMEELIGKYVFGDATKGDTAKSGKGGSL